MIRCLQQGFPDPKSLEELYGTPGKKTYSLQHEYNILQQILSLYQQKLDGLKKLLKPPTPPRPPSFFCGFLNSVANCEKNISKINEAISKVEQDLEAEQSLEQSFFSR